MARSRKKKLELLNKLSKPVADGTGWKKEAAEIQQSKHWSKDATIIAVCILEALEEKGWSQKDLAKELDVTPQAVNKIVKGKQNLTMGTIRKLEEALDISLMILKQNANDLINRKTFDVVYKKTNFTSKVISIAKSVSISSESMDDETVTNQDSEIDEGVQELKVKYA